MEINAEFGATNLLEADRFGFKVRTGVDEETIIGYAAKSRSLFVDRGRSGEVDFSPNFTPIHTTAMSPVDDTIRLHIFVDRSSLELFGNDGLISFTERIFPREESLGVEFFVAGGQVQLNNLDIYNLDSIKITPAEVTGENEDG